MEKFFHRKEKISFQFKKERERETLIRPWNFHVHGMKQLRKVFIVWRTSGCPRKKVACHEPIPSTSDVPNTSHVPRNRG